MLDSVVLAALVRRLCQTQPLSSARKPKKLAAGELYEYAVKTLTARAQSAADLRSKLRLRAAVPADVDRIVDRLREIGYLDDARYADSFASSRVENDGFGRLRVLNDLRARRVAPDMAAKAVDQAIGDRSEADQIEAFIERRMPSLARGGAIDDDRKLAAAYRKLRRAGFMTGPILAALKRRATRPETIEDPPPELEEEDR